MMLLRKVAYRLCSTSLEESPILKEASYEATEEAVPSYAIDYPGM